MATPIARSSSPCRKNSSLTRIDHTLCAGHGFAACPRSAIMITLFIITRTSSISESPRTWSVVILRRDDPVLSSLIDAALERRMDAPIAPSEPPLLGPPSSAGDGCDIFSFATCLKCLDTSVARIMAIHVRRNIRRFSEDISRKSGTSSDRPSRKSSAQWKRSSGLLSLCVTAMGSTRLMRKPLLRPGCLKSCPAAAMIAAYTSSDVRN
mmetsp:Transcript_14198/g.49380  ORF Transcript_14198/g.49380 Transcript_14198/m.49380 type:complete len:209 (-) Transcript_14198:1796-2422(-)